jgi:hypothetical protein
MHIYVSYAMLSNILHILLEYPTALGYQLVIIIIETKVQHLQSHLTNQEGFFM